MEWIGTRWFWVIVLVLIGFIFLTNFGQYWGRLAWVKKLFGFLGKALKGYFGEFGKLLKLPKEFWGIQALNMVYCLAYFAFVTVNTLHLSQDVGFSDEAGGLMVAMFMTGTAILQIFMGPILDRIGFRKTPLIAGAIVTIGFLGIGASPLMFGATPVGRGAVFFFYLVAMVGNGLMFPVLTAGTKRFSNKETQNPAFNFWYLSMNVGGGTSLRDRLHPSSS